jgi:S-DNA-T family DNA segregation ATPase FtsK/SpoIIIE
VTRVDVRVGPVRFHGWRAFLYWLCAALVVLTVRLITWSVCRPRTTAALLGSAVLAWAVLEHPAATLLLLWLPLEVGHAWRVYAPDSWRRRAQPVLLARWRSLWLYRRTWRTAMQVAELDRRDRDGQLEVPRLVRVRCTATTDVVQVRGLLGQRFSEYEAAAPMLAHVFGAVGFVVHRGDDRRLTLELERGDVGRSWNRDGYELGADAERPGTMWAPGAGSFSPSPAGRGHPDR